MHFHNELLSLSWTDAYKLLESNKSTYRSTSWNFGKPPPPVFLCRWNGSPPKVKILQQYECVCLVSDTFTFIITCQWNYMCFRNCNHNGDPWQIFMIRFSVAAYSLWNQSHRAGCLVYVGLKWPPAMSAFDRQLVVRVFFIFFESDFDRIDAALF